MSIYITSMQSTNNDFGFKTVYLANMLIDNRKTAAKQRCSGT